MSLRAGLCTLGLAALVACGGPKVQDQRTGPSTNTASASGGQGLALDSTGSCYKIGSEPVCKTTPMTGSPGGWTTICTVRDTYSFVYSGLCGLIFNNILGTNGRRDCIESIKYETWQDLQKAVQSYITSCQQAKGMLEPTIPNSPATLIDTDDTSFSCVAPGVGDISMQKEMIDGILTGSIVCNYPTAPASPPPMPPPPMMSPPMSPPPMSPPPMNPPMTQP